MGFMDTAGLERFYTRLKDKFALKTHSHTAAQVGAATPAYVDSAIESAITKALNTEV